MDDPEGVQELLADLDPSDPERAEIVEASTALARTIDAAIISRALGIPTKPWELADWPLDDYLAAKALAARWIKSI